MLFLYFVQERTDVVAGSFTTTADEPCTLVTVRKHFPYHGPFFFRFVVFVGARGLQRMGSMVLDGGGTFWGEVAFNGCGKSGWGEGLPGYLCTFVAAASYSLEKLPLVHLPCVWGAAGPR